MTEWWAFTAVGTAFDKTKRTLLEPFNAWTWLKLMVIVFFVGTGANRLGSQFGNVVNYQASPPDTKAYEQAINYILSDTTLIVILIGVFLLVILVALLFAYLRNAFSYVLIQALASGDVHIIKPFMENLGRGFRLFLFTLAVGLLAFAVIICLLIPMIASIIIGIKMGIIALILAIPIFVISLIIMIAFSIAVSIFVGFTYDFVAPMVYFRGAGIIESWKWLWASIKKDWKQYGVYVIARWALELGVGILLMFIALPIALIFIAALLVGIIMAVAAAKASMILTVVIGVALLVLSAIFILILMAITMPVAVYFRYYSLDVLKQIDPSSVVYSGRFSPS
ncbi:DUF7544 domain-containing protein [Methanocella conradii]|uniref:DUF7544 domain-containing protein n=1 Tax=Methanocella conradii TaxID=1175444 RepID=UPI0024B37941|nr:hypothetical protein [Methanocella conradii]MDI6897860.1 hypothetical protein [Methanocella conradii]